MSAESTVEHTPGQRLLPRLDFSTISAPGAYVMDQTGLLIRIPPEALLGRQSVPLSITGRSPVWVHRLSEDPQLTVHAARSLAANHDLYVNF